MSRTSTTALFSEALQLVRRSPIDHPGRFPAFAFPQAIVSAPVPAGGEVEGLPGDLWESADAIRSGNLLASDVLAVARERIARLDRKYNAFEYVAPAARNVLDGADALGSLSFGDIK